MKLIREERWTPVTESGERWKPRALKEAQEAMAAYPAGGEYLNGEPWDGVTHLVHEYRYVSDWMEVDS